MHSQHEENFHICGVSSEHSFMLPLLPIMYHLLQQVAQKREMGTALPGADH